MTTKIRIENDKASNGDVILDGVNTTEGRIKSAALRPGESRELWITTNSVVILTETWPTQPKPAADANIIAECGDSGERWAKAFLRVFPNADEDTMRAWFANAIESATSVRAGRSRPNGETPHAGHCGFPTTGCICRANETSPLG